MGGSVFLLSLRGTKQSRFFRWLKSSDVFFFGRGSHRLPRVAVAPSGLADGSSASLSCPHYYRQGFTPPASRCCRPFRACRRLVCIIILPALLSAGVHTACLALLSPLQGSVAASRHSSSRFSNISMYLLRCCMVLSFSWHSLQGPSAST